MKPDTAAFYADHSVLNLAHRGASFHAPQNTIPAFRLAADLGADGVELDVQLSKDGAAVIIHDFTLNKTTSGRGPVRLQPLATLQTLDAGSHFSPKFAGTPIPTLQELFLALGQVLLFNIELKSNAVHNDGLEAEVIRLVEDFGLLNRVIFSSFNPFSLMRARRINPAIPRGLLWAADLPPHLRWQLFRTAAAPSLFHPDWHHTTLTLVNREHRRGNRVNVWTCNQPQAMQSLMAMGVDGIITDRPDLLKQVIHESTNC